MSIMTDPYALLGIATTATAEEITAAYRTLAQIYHPDRYADAPERVRAEATARMQALNAAYAVARRGEAVGTTPPTPSRRPGASETAAPLRVRYVDGAKAYHRGDVSPLGMGSAAGDGTRCARLDDELGRWLEVQQRSAGVAAQKRYRTWDDRQRMRYAADVGCSTVPRERAAAFAMACPECRP